jgi:hypothetical protein
MIWRHSKKEEDHMIVVNLDMAAQTCGLSLKNV